MKKGFVVVIIGFFMFFGCNNSKNTDQKSGEKTNETELILSVNELLDQTENFAEEPVMVRGTVTHVCKHSGKRLHLKNLETNDMIRVEAGEEIDRFEIELEGSDIILTGNFRRQVIDESYIKDLSKEDHSEGHNHDGESEGEERAKNMRKMLSESGKDKVIIYWIDGVSFEEI